jgi:hypothetical protein
VFYARREELREWLDVPIGRQERRRDGIIVVGHIRILSEFDSG